MKKLSFLILGCIIILSSCKTPKDITYFQDLHTNSTMEIAPNGTIRFQPGDKLSIFVHSRDPQLMALFNITGNNTYTNTNSSMQGKGYTVDRNGEIDFPVLGLVKIQGLTRNEVERTIKRELVSRDLCKDPVVIVEFSNMSFSVLGDVSGPGTHQITKDQITVLEAIAMSGDLTINGKRKNIMVLRQEDGQQKPYWIDMTNASSINNSPVYYVKQNDIIYVEPNNVRKRQSTVNGSTVFTPAFWMSITSFLVGLSAIFIK